MLTSSAEANFSRVDAGFMRRAIALARRGAGLTHPNPAVGAVIVNNCQIVGVGWHEGVGRQHAEVAAIASAGALSFGATLYVTLEPCNHYGRTPPCTEAIYAAGIRRVVVAMRDPNRSVTGGGIEQLKSHGLEVSEGLLSRQAQELNIGWIKHCTQQRSHLALKLAVSIDGFIAANDADTRWISGPIARAHVQRLRRCADGVIVGIGTVLADDPQLNNRSGKGGQPYRIVVDSRCRTPESARLFASDGGAVIIATSERADSGEIRRLKNLGADVIICDANESGRISLASLLSQLYRKGLFSLFCEGGSYLAGSFLAEGLVDEIRLYRSSRFLGAGVPMFRTAEPIDSRFSLKEVKRIGGDSMATYIRSNSVSSPRLILGHVRRAN